MIYDLGHDKAPILENELTEKLFQAKELDWMEPASVNQFIKPVNAQALMEMSKITPADLARSLKIGMLVQDENGCFNLQDVKIAALIAQVRENLNDERGFSFEFITMRHDLIRDLVDQEFEYFFRASSRAK